MFFRIIGIVIIFFLYPFNLYGESEKFNNKLHKREINYTFIVEKNISGIPDGGLASFFINIKRKTKYKINFDQNDPNTIIFYLNQFKNKELKEFNIINNTLKKIYKSKNNLLNEYKYNINNKNCIVKNVINKNKRKTLIVTGKNINVIKLNECIIKGFLFSIGLSEDIVNNNKNYIVTKKRIYLSNVFIDFLRNNISSGGRQ